MKDEGGESHPMAPISFCSSSSFILHPSSFILHPSSFILHPFFPCVCPFFSDLHSGGCRVQRRAGGAAAVPASRAAAAAGRNPSHRRLRQTARRRLRSGRTATPRPRPAPQPAGARPDRASPPGYTRKPRPLRSDPEQRRFSARARNLFFRSPFLSALKFPVEPPPPGPRTFVLAMPPAGRFTVTALSQRQELLPPMTSIRVYIGKSSPCLGHPT